MAFSRGHRGHGLSLGASVDLDVEGGAGSRLEEDYDGGWSSSNLAWSAKGPAAFLPSLSVKDTAKLHLTWAKAGWSDANRWQEAIRVAMGAPDIRLGIIKGLVLSGILSALIFFFELAFFPSQLFGPPAAARQHLSSAADQGPQTIASIGSVFFLYPLIAGCYFLASSWTMDVAQAAHRMRHGRGFSMGMNSIPAGTSRRILQESYRVLLVINFVLVSFVLEKLPIPFVGRALSFFFMSFIDAYYCFEQVWIARGWSLERRMRYAESRWSYMMAFGLPSTAVSFFHPSGLLNLMLFLLVFPMCTVLAMLATPQPRVAPNSGAGLTPGAAGGGASSYAAGSSASMQLSSVLPPRLPIFWPTIKLYRLVLRVFPYSLEAAANAAASMQSRTGLGMGGKTTPDARWRAAGGSGMAGLGGASAYAAAAGANAGYGVNGGGYAAYGGAKGAGYGASATTTLAGGGTSLNPNAPGLAGRRSAAQFVGGAWGGAGAPGFANGGAPGIGGGAGAGTGSAQVPGASSAYQAPTLGGGQWGVSTTGATGAAGQQNGSATGAPGTSKPLEVEKKNIPPPPKGPARGAKKND